MENNNPIEIVSLRDHFAMRAMQSLIRSTGIDQEFLAVKSYEIADAMLKHRVASNRSKYGKKKLPNKDIKIEK